MQRSSEKLVEAEKDGYETYEVTHIERRMTEQRWQRVQDELDARAAEILTKQRGWYRARK